MLDTLSKSYFLKNFVKKKLPQEAPLFQQPASEKRDIELTLKAGAEKFITKPGLMDDWKEMMKSIAADCLTKDWRGPNLGQTPIYSHEPQVSLW